jgi:hypothetical protein
VHLDIEPKSFLIVVGVVEELSCNCNVADVAVVGACGGRLVMVSIICADNWLVLVVASRVLFAWQSEILR